MKRSLLGAVVIVIVAACGTSPAGSVSPSSSNAGGAAGLLADLQRAGAATSPQGTFAPDPLPGRGLLLCVNGEVVRLYVYSSTAERAQATARIDRNDPSHVGSAMVDWVGRPRFWQRDRIAVLYLGPTQATETLLTSVLGMPFARGQGGLPSQTEACS